MGSSEGAVQLRYNYYPKIPDLSKVKARQIRCGEHTDYGAISVLFQDDIGGLEVLALDILHNAVNLCQGALILIGWLFCSVTHCTVAPGQIFSSVFGTFQ